MSPAAATNLFPSAEQATVLQGTAGALVGVQGWEKPRFTKVTRPPKPATSNTGYFCRMHDGNFILLFLFVSGARHLNFVILMASFVGHTVFAVETRRCVRTG